MKHTDSRIYSYLVSKHGAFEYKRGWLRVPICMFCGKEEKLGIRLQDNRTNCFVCGSHGSPLDLIKEVENLPSIKETLYFLESFTAYEYRPKRFIPPTFKPPILPSSYINIAFGESPTARMARKYIMSRGFLLEELSKKGIGYIEGKNEELYGHIIIPFFKKGKLIYYQGRRYLGFGTKYHNPSYDEMGVGKNVILYNEDSLDKYSEVNILEGALNVLTLGDNGIALGGKVVSDWQKSRLMGCKVTRFNIILDSDALEEAFKLAMYLTLAHKEVRVIRLPEDKDPNDLGRIKTLEIINSNPVMGSHNQALTQWNNAKAIERRFRKAL
jgi:hypothetical protein